MHWRRQWSSSPCLIFWKLSEHLETSVVLHSRTSPCQLKSLSCSLDESASVPWIILAAFLWSFYSTTFFFFVRLFVFQALEPKISRCGCDLAWYFLFLFSVPFFAISNTDFLLLPELPSVLSQCFCGTVDHSPSSDWPLLTYCSSFGWKSPQIPVCEISIHHTLSLWISPYILLLFQVHVSTLGQLYGKACNQDKSLFYFPHKSSETKQICISSSQSLRKYGIGLSEACVEVNWRPPE